MVRVDITAPVGSAVKVEGVDCVGSDGRFMVGAQTNEGLGSCTAAVVGSTITIGKPGFIAVGGTDSQIDTEGGARVAKPAEVMFFNIDESGTELLVDENGRPFVVGESATLVVNKLD